MSTQPKTLLTPEQYLEIELKAEYKSEYYNGEMFAMAGASERHITLAYNLYGLTQQYLRGKKCRGFTSDLRVLVSGSGLYTYPDFTATCDEPKFSDTISYTLLNPTLIAEILSPSTEDYDRGRKNKLYRTIPSLQEYLIISQERPECELYRRQADGTWSLIEAAGFNASIELASIQFQLNLPALRKRTSRRAFRVTPFVFC